MDKFQQAEDKGRSIFIPILVQLGFTDIQESNDKFDNVDIRATSPNGNKCIFEIKDRNDYYTEFLMEKFKYDAMIKIISDYNQTTNDIYQMEGYYVSIYKNIAFIFSLSVVSNYSNNIKSISCPRQTMGDNTKIDKEVIVIPTNQSMIYYYNDEGVLMYMHPNPNVPLTLNDVVPMIRKDMLYT